jgi:hypothetical protein
MTTIHEIDCDEVLARGLTTIARSADQHWVFGHNGAAIMSGAWLLRDGSLPDASAARLAKRLRKTLDLVPGHYPLPDAAPGHQDTAPLLAALEGQIGTLRNGAHGTIYSALVLRHLAERPDLASKATIEGLVAVYEGAQIPDFDRHFGIPDYREVAIPPRRESAAAKGLGGELIVACLRELETLYPDEVIDEKRYFFASEKTHIVTHLHALLELNDQGHVALAERGVDALLHQLEVARVVPPQGRIPYAPGTVTPNDPSYWRVKTGADPWHDIKVAHAMGELLARLTSGQRATVEKGVATAWASLA